MFADDYDDRRREVHETPEQKLKGAIIKLGEVVSAPSNHFHLGTSDPHSA